MRLARARPADQDDVAPVRQEGATVQGAHQPLVDRRVVEHEGVEVLHRRQLGRRHPVADGGRVPVGCLGADQVGENLHGRALALQSRGDRLVEGAGHPLQAQAGQRRHHLMPLHAGLAGCRSGCSRPEADAAAPGLPA